MYEKFKTKSHNLLKVVNKNLVDLQRQAKLDYVRFNKIITYKTDMSNDWN